jgi:hypothetical protein
MSSRCMNGLMHCSKIALLYDHRVARSNVTGMSRVERRRGPEIDHEFGAGPERPGPSTSPLGGSDV